ncbi:hypothetical protein J6590_021221 [Homalodisca vitripennis]|nr:hypothetical protein J6590_021221 [Homalodisca vitripennis]
MSTDGPNRGRIVSGNAIFPSISPSCTSQRGRGSTVHARTLGFSKAHVRGFPSELTQQGRNRREDSERCGVALVMCRRRKPVLGRYCVRYQFSLQLSDNIRIV